MADFGQNMSSQFIFVNNGSFINLIAVKLEFGIYSFFLYRPSSLQQTNTLYAYGVCGIISLFIILCIA